MKPCAAIGVDIGGTKIAAGLVHFPEGKIAREKTIPTHAEKCVADVQQLLRELHSPEVVAIGIGICELVSPQGEVLSHSTIPPEIAKLRGVRFEADVRAAALAEARLGAGKSARSFLYVTIGTGISSCLVIGGKPYTGARGATGTLASGPLPPNQPPLETFASGHALAKAFGKSRAEEILASPDSAALTAVHRAASSLGATIGWLVSMLDPELVVLGGGLGLVGGSFRTVLAQAAREHIWWHGHRNLPILSAQTGAAAGIIGAALCAVEQA